MNAQTFARRIDAILEMIENDGEYDVTSPVNGRVICMWHIRAHYFVCYADDIKGRMGWAFRGNAYDVRNECMRLAGY